VTLLRKRNSPPSDSHQPESADVGLGHVQNFFGCAGLDELGQHLAPEVTRVLDLAVEFAVGERARAAFAELHIGFGIQHRFAPQAPGVLRAFAHGFAALQNKRIETHLRQQQAREQTARAAADHYGALCQPVRRMRHKLVTGIRRYL
jgi:hypothetical protein